MKKIAYFLVIFSLYLMQTQGAARAQDVVSIKSEKNQEIITLHVPRTDGHKVFILSNPDRLVVDVPFIGEGISVGMPATYNGTWIKTVRVGRFNADTSRLVFDLTSSISVGAVDNGNGRPLVITIGPNQKDGTTKTATEKKSSKDPIRKKRPTMPVIVIDAGHGGEDPGTHGPKGTREKDIVLEYAKALKTRLVNTGKYQVKLTRDVDKFIPLRGRVAIARKAGAAIFISLHADSAPEGAARGLSVYTVSETASDQEAEALAARENKADVISSMDLSEEREDVAGILISLAQRDTKNQSATLADMLVMKLGDKVNLLENTHRFAGFAVLKAPDIPSVLIEIGFLSNASEEKLLKSKSYRDKIVSGIASGIDGYFANQQLSGE